MAATEAAFRLGVELGTVTALRLIQGFPIAMEQFWLLRNPSAERVGVRAKS